MQVAIHNVSPTGGPSQAAFQALAERVGRLREQLEEINKPGALEGLIKSAIRPLAAELALREKEAVTHVTNRSDEFEGYDLNSFMEA